MPGPTDGGTNCDALRGEDAAEDAADERRGRMVGNTTHTTWLMVHGKW
jgi:hypothetical protein